jgi:hypothetical protein
MLISRSLGTYTIEETIYLDTDTVIIGDAANPPVIKAAASFTGDYLIVGGQGDGSSHPCGGSGGETHFSVMRALIMPTSAECTKSRQVLTRTMWQSRT